MSRAPRRYVRIAIDQFHIWQALDSWRLFNYVDDLLRSCGVDAARIEYRHHETYHGTLVTTFELMDHG